MKTRAFGNRSLPHFILLLFSLSIPTWIVGCVRHAIGNSYSTAS